MTDMRKVSASAGAEWLMGGFSLLRRSPFGLGLLGAIFGLVSLASLMLASAGVAVALLQQLAMMLIGPLAIAGMVWAAREVDQGRSANPGHLLRGVRDGKAARLWATLLPQIAAGLVAMILLVVLVGPTQLQAFLAAIVQMQGQASPDPSQFAGFPLGRFMLWLLLALVIAVVAGFFTFTAIPDMMFGETGAVAAMKRSFRACLRNLPAMIVFFVLVVIAMIAIGFAVQLVGLVVKLVAGESAMLFVSQVLMMAVIMPVMTGAMYMAWKQMIAGDTAAPRQDSGSGLVEA